MFLNYMYSACTLCVWDLLEPMAGINTLEIAMNDDFCS